MANIKLVLVDDDVDFVDTMTGLLKYEGFDVIPVTHSTEALEKVRQEKPDLILLDIMMPELDGLQVCKQLKSDAEVKSIPVVMLTAIWEKQHISAALEAGAENYFMKPVSVPHLSAKLKEILGGRMNYEG